MIILVIIALLSAVFHNLTEINSVKKQLEAAGKTFSWSEHVRRNWLAWVVTLFPILILALSHPHIIAKFPSIEGWMFAVYIAVGWGGSDLAIVIFSTSQRRLTKVISNLAGEESNTAN